MDFLHYGLQRSGTNFLKALMLKNFSKANFHNGEVRAVVTHKHFRLYEEKEYVPESKYHNELNFDSFAEFDEACAKETGINNLAYLVIAKNPYSWYLSITKMAASLDWESYDAEKAFQAHYIHDFNKYYGKWKSFADEAPDRVFLMKYEDLLAETDAVMCKIQSQFNLKRKKDLRHLIYGKEGQFFGVKRVANSKNWDEKRKSFYLDKEFFNALKPEEKAGFEETLDFDLMKRMGFQSSKG